MIAQSRRLVAECGVLRLACCLPMIATSQPASSMRCLTATGVCSHMRSRMSAAVTIATSLTQSHACLENTACYVWGVTERCIMLKAQLGLARGCGLG